MSVLNVRYRHVKSEKGESLFELMLASEHVESQPQALTWPTLIAEVSRELNEHEYERLVFHRTDHGGLSPMAATPDEMRLIRDNPIRYVEITSHEARRVVIRTPPSVPLTRSEPMLRAGYDTLADAFGDEVYIRIRDDNNAECPRCGRWRCRLNQPDYITIELECGCGFQYRGQGEPSRGWVPLSTDRLLECAAVKFFLPRAWNKSGPWIHRDLLLTMYRRYISEKADA